MVSHVEKAAPPFSGSELWALLETMIRTAQIAPSGKERSFGANAPQDDATG